MVNASSATSDIAAAVLEPNFASDQVNHNATQQMACKSDPYSLTALFDTHAVFVCPFLPNNGHQPCHMGLPPPCARVVFLHQENEDF